MNTLMWAVSASVNVTTKEKQPAVIVSLSLVVFLKNRFFLLVSMVPKTSFGILCMSLRQKLLIKLLPRRFGNPIIEISVLVCLGFFN